MWEKSRVGSNPIRCIQIQPTNVDITVFVGCFFNFPHEKPTKSFFVREFLQKRTRIFAYFFGVFLQLRLHIHTIVEYLHDLIGL